MPNNSTHNNPLICDPLEGVCGVPGTGTKQAQLQSGNEKPLKLIYFTDPICSSCWGIEPQLRKLKLEYGSSLEIDYRMGGLLPDWTYNSGSISKPSDVAHHWDEVSVHYDMPIDGDVWLEDPLHSSFPPSIAFKAAQLQDKEKAIRFLRALREMVFLQKKNITKREHINTAAQKAGLDTVLLNSDMNTGGKIAFEKDLKLAKEYGVRGFPTLFFVSANGEREIVYGTKPYPFYETAILKLYPAAAKGFFEKNWKNLFSKYPSLTAREFSELSGMPRAESEKVLDDLVLTGTMEKLTTKRGSIWTIRHQA